MKEIQKTMERTIQYLFAGYPIVCTKKLFAIDKEE
jgi:hypothetical protein